MTGSFFQNESQDQKKMGQIPGLESGLTGENNADRNTAHNFITEEGRLAAIMSYIPFLCFIPLLNMKENKEAHFHARQGVILFLIELIAVIFLIDGVSDLVFKGVLLIGLGLSAAGIYFALQGRNYRLPIVSDLAEKSRGYTDIGSGGGNPENHE